LLSRKNRNTTIIKLVHGRIYDAKQTPLIIFANFEMDLCRAVDWPKLGKCQQTIRVVSYLR